MIRFVEILLLAAMPITALFLRGQSFGVTAAVLSSLGVGFLILLSVGHHSERTKLSVSKFAEYAVLTLSVVVSYLFLV